MKNKCPQCAAEMSADVLYQCVRCFTKYCQDCEGTDGGRRCPKCGMGCRLVMPPEKQAGK